MTVNLRITLELTAEGTKRITVSQPRDEEHPEQDWEVCGIADGKDHFLGQTLLDQLGFATKVKPK